MGVLLGLLFVILGGPLAIAEGHQGARNASARLVGGHQSGELAYYGRGDASAYRVYRANAGSGWRWAELAAIRPGGRMDDSWIGYQCTTGNGRHVVAVIAPRHAANRPGLANGGATAYSIDTRSGSVRPLVAGVALKYHSPGCGEGDRVALPSYLGEDGRDTRLRIVDASSGKLLEDSSIRGHVTSVVPTPHGRVVAADGALVVTLRRGRVEDRVRAAGVAFRLSVKRGVTTFLAKRGNEALVQRVVGGRARTLLRGPLQRTALLSSGAGPVAVGFQGRANGIRTRKWPASLADVESTSRDGDAIVGVAEEEKARIGGHDEAGAASLPAVPLTVIGPDQGVTAKLPGGARPVVTRLPAVSRRARGRGATANTTTPKCAVPRNDLRRQVPQPNAKQVDWAIQQAVRGNLKGATLTRPANFLNMGLASYQPSNDFSPTSLTGGGSIPPSVAQAIYAQETNWKQASFHALPGLSGNPLVSDYYGAGGGIDSIDYDQADCGYGVSQVTDPMSAASPTYSANGKAKVAVDYAENIAAGLQILAQKWNQLKAAGITMNNGNPAYLENWYFAIWAYNSGFHAQVTGSPWGLGWTNNPQNADYDPARTPFLRVTYADAAHPADWPYQERVIGFMESPLLDYKGRSSYAKPTNIARGGLLALPGHDAFCVVSANECSPTYVNAADPTKSYCMRDDRKCWWNQPVTHVDCSANCTTSAFTYAIADPEPATDPNYLPACSSTLPSGSIVVDNQPTNLNVEGCGGGNWTNAGSFDVTLGSGVAVIDWHQLGAGFGGHTFFTHNRPPTDLTHRVTGTWTPAGLTAGRYAVSVHIPSSGASSEAASYTIDRGDGTTISKSLNQHLHANRWMSLGEHDLQPGARVVLTNVTAAASGTTTVAYDSVAFTRVASQPTGPEDDLAKAFRPALFFDTSEKWRPLNVPSFLTERGADGQPTHARCIDDHDVGTAGEFEHDPPEGLAGRYTLGAGDDTATCAPIQSAVDLLKWRSDRTFLHINRTLSDDEGQYASPYQGCRQGSRLDCNGGEAGLTDRSAIYYSLAPAQSAYQFIEYWFFYRFNSFSDGTDIGNHQGDWEAVAIAPNGDSFEFASFSGHGRWYSYLRDALTCVDIQDQEGSCGSEQAPVGRRIKVFVANGSHANYGFGCSEFPSTCHQSMNDRPERGYDGAVAWGRNAEPAAVLPMPALGTGGWPDWAGHWGASGAPLGDGSPRSPGVQSMFNQPWGTCDYRNPGCALPRSAARPSGKPGRADLGNRVRNCDTWFGPGVNAMACDRGALGRSIANRELGSSRRARIRVLRSASPRRVGGRSLRGSVERSAASAAVAQSLGAPLRVGDRVEVRGAGLRRAHVSLKVAEPRNRVRVLSWAVPERSGLVTLEVIERRGTLRLRRVESDRA